MLTVPPKSFETNPIFRVSALLGLFPFTDGPNFELDKSLLAYSFVFTTVVILVGGLTMLRTLKNDLTSVLSESYNQAIILAYIGGLILVFPCSLYCAFLKRNEVQKTFQAMKDMQRTFEQIKLSSFNKWTHILPLLDISVPILCTLLIYVTNSSVPGTAFGTFYSLALIGICLICGQLSFLTDLIGDIFDAGIVFLNEMKLSLIIKRHTKRISELVKVANKLTDISCSLNEIYSQQILIIMSLCFCGFSIHLYYISLFTTLPSGFTTDLLLPQVYSVLFYFYVSWRVNNSSAETSEKSKEFNTLLYQLMINDKTNEILLNDKLRLHISMKREVVFTACGFFNLDYTLVHSSKEFNRLLYHIMIDDKTDGILHNEKLRLHISMKREVVFTACGFFNLNYTLVHSMIASGTTYLVILIQFGQPGSMSDNLNLESSELTNLTSTPLPLSQNTYL